MAPGRLAYTLQESPRDELEMLQRQQAIVQLGIDETSKWCNSIMLMPKGNGKVILCLDPAMLGGCLLDSRMAWSVLLSVDSGMALQPQSGSGESEAGRTLEGHCHGRAEGALWWWLWIANCSALPSFSCDALAMHVSSPQWGQTWVYVMYWEGQYLWIGDLLCLFQGSSFTFDPHPKPTSHL